MGDLPYKQGLRNTPCNFSKTSGSKRSNSPSDVLRAMFIRHKPLTIVHGHESTTGKGPALLPVIPPSSGRDVRWKTIRVISLDHQRPGHRDHDTQFDNGVIAKALGIRPLGPCVEHKCQNQKRRKHVRTLDCQLAPWSIYNNPLLCFSSSAGLATPCKPLPRQR